MVIDTSAIAAIVFDEPERQRFMEAIVDADRRLMSAASRLECTLTIEGRKGATHRKLLEECLFDAAIEIVPVSARQAEIACEAWRRFGK